MDLWISLSTALLPSLMKIGKTLFENSSLDPLADQGLGQLGKWIECMRGNKQAESELKACMMSALDEVQKDTPDAFECLKMTQWVTGKEAVVYDMLAIAAVEMVESDAKIIPDVLAQALNVDETQRSLMSKYLSHLRKHLMYSKLFAPLVGYADRYDIRSSLSDMKYSLAGVDRNTEGIAKNTDNMAQDIHSIDGNLQKLVNHIEQGIRDDEPTGSLLPGSQNKVMNIKEVRQRYLRSIIDQCRTIRLSGIDPDASDPQRGRMSLEKLYVSLDTKTPRGKEKRDERGRTILYRDTSEPISVLEAWRDSRCHRMVLLGLPGTGKSTFVRYLALSMAKALFSDCDVSIDWNNPVQVPFMISLGRFADSLPTDCKKGCAELMEEFFIENLKEENDKEDFTSFLIYTLKKDGALVMFDGLDEVADLKLRPLVVQAVQDFVEKYQQNSENYFLVTCRTYSYEHDPDWQLTGWETHELALLERYKINQFICAWYAELSRIEPARQIEYQCKQDDLLKTLQPDDRRHLLHIAAFPIILTIMAVVHTQVGSLPDTQAQVYERCIALLLVRWEGERPVQGKLEKQNILDALQVPESVLSQALWEVAYTAHEAGKNEQAGLVTEELLNGVMKVYLKESEKVDAFLKYCDSSNGLLMYQGTTPGAGKMPRKIYAFPHLTFEEYLAARFMAAELDADDCAFDMVGRSDRWREAIMLLGEHLCFGSPQRIIMNTWLSALCNVPQEATQEERGRMIWLAGDLLLLYRRAFPNKTAYADADIFEQLQVVAVETKVSPRIRVACADLADELGYRPDDLYRFVPIPSQQNPEFYIARYPVTNLQYERFLRPENFDERGKCFWCDLPMFSAPDRNGIIKYLGSRRDEGWQWLKHSFIDNNENIIEGVLYPRMWLDSSFGVDRSNAPVVGISWWEANAYCRWLQQHWAELLEGQQNLPQPLGIRLPTEAEWVQMAGGDEEYRFAWGKLAEKDNIIDFANTRESSIGYTTPVWIYQKGKSKPHKLMDLSGNVWEWQVNTYEIYHDQLMLRGGSWYVKRGGAYLNTRINEHPEDWNSYIGFRVLVIFH